MYLIRNKRFKRDYKKLSLDIQRRAEEKIELFAQNPKHPSLRIKKLKKYTNIHEGRVTKTYRFLFSIEGDICTLLQIGTHDILDKL